MVKITAGYLKGKHIKTSKSLRLTEEKVKNSFFNIVSNKVEGSYFLDLFAGSGNIGIEALSRNAKFCYFVEKEPVFCQTILQNLTNLGLLNKARVYNRSEFQAIKLLADKPIDIIYIDPPYFSYIEYQNLLEKLCMIVKNNTIICIEHFKKIVLPEEIMNLTIYKQAKYGDTILSFFTYKK